MVDGSPNIKTPACRDAGGVVLKSSAPGSELGPSVVESQAHARFDFRPQTASLFDSMSARWNRHEGSADS